MAAKPKDEDTATPAVSEAIDPDQIITIEFGGHSYSFKRKRLTAAQFRLPMQKGHNEVATEWLLGYRSFAEFLQRNTDEDGCTTQKVFFDFVDKLGEALGTGNS